MNANFQLQLGREETLRFASQYKADANGRSPLGKFGIAVRRTPLAKMLRI
jgi:hypothetical protein